MASELRVRYRIDGRLQPVPSPPHRLAAAVISRIKIMAKLNIAERRLAQDGRISMAVRGQDIDFRVATTPTIHGESVTLRILDRSHLELDFAALGFDESVTQALRSVLDHPYGIVLVTGPTGSGKTTTLYTALLELNTPDRKILTIEDPVEYQLAGINQTQIKPQIGLTFASALRSFLRHDPDIMMVGEIRDTETAEIAVQAALTGHLILSTLHTNDAASAVTRLLDMGVANYLITSTLNGIAAQRLVRKLCAECREAYLPSAELLDRLGCEDGRNAIFYKPLGCAACHETGYRGRSSIAEVLLVSEDIRKAVLRGADANELQRIATDQGMQSLYANGLGKVLTGVTSVEELWRATRAT
jgi:general secretion pathway protein E